MANAMFVHVCLNLLKRKDRICHSFSTQGNGRKGHTCFKFAVVSKSTDNMVFFVTFGWVPSKHDVKTKILQGRNSSKYDKYCRKQTTFLKDMFRNAYAIISLMSS